MPPRTSLAWDIVSKRVSFLTAHGLLQWINGSVSSAWNNEAKSICTTITVQRDKHYAIGSNTNILGMPWTEAEKLVLRRDLSKLIRTGFVHEQQTNRLMRIILCGIDTDGIVLDLQWDEIGL